MRDIVFFCDDMGKAEEVREKFVEEINGEIEKDGKTCISVGLTTNGVSIASYLVDSMHGIQKDPGNKICMYSDDDSQMVIDFSQVEKTEITCGDNIREWNFWFQKSDANVTVTVWN